MRTHSKSIMRARLSSNAGVSADAGVCQWLESFATAVRNADYQRGRELFADNVVAFCTSAIEVAGLDQLVARQWKNVWEHTRNFQFDLDHLHCGVEAEFAWAAVPFSSQGQSKSHGWFDRHGRATYILQRRDDRWLAIHSHHSLNPNSPDVQRP
jgi:ketosteroid isomerase-like protein